MTVLEEEANTSMSWQKLLTTAEAIPNGDTAHQRIEPHSVRGSCGSC